MAIVYSCIIHVTKHCVVLWTNVFFPLIFRVFHTLSLKRTGSRSSVVFSLFPVRSHRVSMDDRRPRRPHAFFSVVGSRTVPSHVSVPRQSVSFRSFQAPAGVIPSHSFLFIFHPFRCPPICRKARRFSDPTPRRVHATLVYACRTPPPAGAIVFESPRNRPTARRTDRGERNARAALR